MRSIDDLEVTGRRVLLRSDLNVPLDLTGTGEITDDGRIRASLPVISKLSDRGARVIILAHLGRPKGATLEERAAGGPSLRPVAARLAELLGRPVSFATDVAGASATETLLHAFTGLADGCVPAAGLTLGQDGFLYGTTNSGGTSSSGTVYELIP